MKRSKFRGLRKGDRVEVEWLDAAAMTDWDDKVIREWINEGGAHAKTIGYVAHFDDKGILLPCEQFSDGTRRGITYIPAGMVTKVRKLK